MTFYVIPAKAGTQILLLRRDGSHANIRRMDKKLTDALAKHDLILWTREGKHYAVVGHKDHEPGVEHHVSEHEFDELKKLGAKVEHAPHQVNR